MTYFRLIACMPITFPLDSTEYRSSSRKPFVSYYFPTNNNKFSEVESMYHTKMHHLPAGLPMFACSNNCVESYDTSMMALVKGQLW